MNPNLAALLSDVISPDDLTPRHVAAVTEALADAWASDRHDVAMLAQKLARVCDVLRFASPAIRPPTSEDGRQAAFVLGQLSFAESYAIALLRNAMKREDPRFLSILDSLFYRGYLTALKACDLTIDELATLVGTSAKEAGYDVMALLAFDVAAKRDVEGPSKIGLTPLARLLLRDPPSL